MKKQFIVIMAIASMLISNLIIANPTTFEESLSKIKESIEQAYMQFDEAKLLNAYAITERALAQYPEENLLKYYKAYAEYRLLTLAMVNKDRAKFNKYEEVALDGCRNLLDSKALVAEANVLMAAVNMMKLAIDHDAGPDLVPKIHSLIDKSLEIDPENPRAHLTRGQMLFNTPEFFGGSVKGAIREYKAAISEFEKNRDEDIYWGYLETLTALGQAYHKNGEIEEARNTYNKVLSISPEYGYVKYKLLPMLDTDTAKAEKSDKKNVCKLTVNFIGMDNDDGMLMVALNNSQSNFEGGEPYKGISTLVKGNKATVVFEDLPYGEYAVSAFHDEDNDGELNTAAFGIPTEGYGFSNDARGSFGPADYDDAKFILDSESKTISITIE